VSLKDLHCVLGDPGILESAAEAARSAVIFEGGVVVGLACFELLYGPYAEMALAVRDRSRTHLVHDLVEELVPHVRRHRAHTLQARLTPEQADMAAAIRGADVRDGLLELRLEPLPA
jgi:hypothetical protein